MHRVRRWLGATAAAGLVAGFGIGQLMHIHPEPSEETVDATRNAALVSPEAPPLRPSSQPPADDSSAATDDLFLDELELVLSGPQVPQLSPLDELTPRIRDVAVDVW